jgi:hypothetical protein
MEYMDKIESFAFPPLLWVVQNFFQDTIQDRSPKDWLLSLLEARPKGTANTLKDLYKEIDCETLWVPADVSRESLAALDKLSYQDLSPIYRQDIERLRNKVHKSLPKKSFNKDISGTELAELIKVIVNSANSNEFPALPSFWDGFIKLSAIEALDESIKYYVETFTAEIDDKVLATRVINELANEIKEKIMKHFTAYTFKTDSPEKGELEEQIKAKENEFMSKNDDKISDFCQKERMIAKAWLTQNISHIILPMISEDLLLISKELTDVTLQKYVSSLDLLKDEKDAISNQNTLVSEITGEITGMEAENYKRIRDIIMNSKKAAANAFVEYLGEFKYKALSIAESIKVFSEGKAKGIEILDTIVGEYKVEVLADGLHETMNDIYGAQFESFSKANDERIKTEIKKSYMEIMNELARLLKTIKLPQSSVAIKAEAANLYNPMQDRWRKSFSKFEGSNALENMVTEFKTFFDSHIEILLNDNKHKLFRIQEDEWVKLREELLIIHELYYLKDTFDHYARNFASERLNKRVGDKILAKEMVDQFIEEEVPKMGRLFRIKDCLITIACLTTIAAILTAYFFLIKARGA